MIFVANSKVASKYQQASRRGAEKIKVSYESN
jgi:hypothetical protein